MMNIRIIAAVILAALCVSAVSACASGPDDADEGVVAVETPGPDLAESFGAGSTWLYRGSTVVGVAGSTPNWEEVAAGLLPLADEGVEDQEPGTPPQLARELEEEVYRGLGFDPTRADTVVSGVGGQIHTAVFFGDFDVSPEGTKREIAGHSVYRVQGLYGIDTEFLRIEMHLDIFAIDDPKPGVVVLFSLNDGYAESFLESRHQDEAGLTLAAEEHSERFEPLLKDYRDRSAAVVVDAANTERWPEGIVTKPSRLMMSYGEAFELVVEGEPEVLDAFAEFVDETVDSARDGMDTGGRENASLLERLSATVSYHGVESVARQLEPTRSDTRLVYRVEGDGDAAHATGWSRLFALGGALRPFADAARGTRRSPPPRVATGPSGDDQDQRSPYQPSDGDADQDQFSPYQPSDGDADADEAVTEPDSADASPGSDDETDAATEREYTVERTTLQEALDNPGARLMPNYRDGQMDGIRVIGVEPDQGVSILRIRSGDVVLAIDGETVNDRDDVFVFERLKEVSEQEQFTLRIQRRGDEQTWRFTVE